jgi:hypothetical protein
MKDTELVDKLVLMLVSGVTVEAVEHAAVTKLNVDAAKAKRLVKRAQTAITRAAEYAHDEELGTSYLRLNDLYTRAIKASDVKTALAAQRELNRLLDLYEGSAADVPEAADADTSAELELIRQHLLPLALAPESYPLHEHARIAADRLRQAEVPDG